MSPGAFDDRVLDSSIFHVGRTCGGRISFRPRIWDRGWYARRVRGVALPRVYPTAPTRLARLGRS